VALRCIFVVAALLAAESAVAQRRAATPQEALSYLHSAFLTQADPGVMSKGVTLGPELQKGLSLPAMADGAKVYDAIITIVGTKRVNVRPAAPQEITAYGARRGFQPKPEHVLYTLEAGELRFLLQYDLQHVRIPFVGQLGVPDPDARPAAVKKAEPEKAPLLNLIWTSMFELNSAILTTAARAKLDSEIVPKIAGVPDVRFIVSGHSDRLGAVDYNRELSEKRAQAVRTYLLEKGVDPERIEVFGYGQTLPVASCPEQERAILIDCLAPNRRVVVEIQAQ
jgi:outer membrane protein OmpA-like peptidoglycan-associated protein